MHFESQHLQQVTEVVTRANLPPRAGLLAQDFRNPTAWKQWGVCVPEKHKTQKQQPMCASHSAGGIPPGSFHQPPRSIRNPSSKSGLVLFLLGVVPVQTHSQQDLSGSFHEKNVTFFSWAQKTQINNSLLLIRPKTAPRFGRPVFQLPPRGSWEECARGWVLGGRRR